MVTAESHPGRGFSAIEAIIIVFVVAVIGFGGYFVLSKNKKDQPTSNQTSSNTTQQGTGDAQKIMWQLTGENTWQPSGAAPTCPGGDRPLKSPLDTSLATGVLMPGAYRGYNYKAHGGFRFDNNKAEDITVRLPMDGRLTGLVRYIENGDLQYIVELTNSCGIMYRFDHLHKLSPAFQAEADKTPEAKVDDTRSQPIENGPTFKAGDVVATAVGHPTNVGMDFGVYDLRKRNEISKNATWADLHKDYSAQTFYGVCWFDMLPKADSDRIWQLVNAAPKAKTVSDYCKTPGGNTLQYNDGKPTNG